MTQNKKKPTKAKASGSTRKIKTKEQAYASFRLSKKLKHPDKLPKARRIFARTWRTYWQNKKVFGGLLAIFFVLTIVFVQGARLSGEASDIQFIVEDLIDGATGRLLGGIAVLGLFTSSVANAPSDVAGVYQTIFFILMSLAIIYALRKLHVGKTIGIRDALYNSTYPLVPFVLTLFVIGLQLIPFAVGSWLFSTVSSAGLAAHPVEQLMWAIIFFLLALLSLYMVASSIFALYIVTLPDMRPMQSLRSARKLVYLRRWAIMRKLIFAPFVLVILGFLVSLPFAIFVPVLAEYIVLLYFLFGSLFFYGYVYELYRELL